MIAMYGHLVVGAAFLSSHVHHVPGCESRLVECADSDVCCFFPAPTAAWNNPAMVRLLVLLLSFAHMFYG